MVEHSSEGTERRQSWTGRLNLVDLAGSERPRLTGWVGWVGLGVTQVAAERLLKGLGPRSLGGERKEFLDGM